jgi:hypothetical protein
MKYRLTINIDFEESDDPSARTKAKYYLDKMKVYDYLPTKEDFIIKLRKIIKDKEPQNVKL